MWLKGGNRAGDGRESHLTQTGLTPTFTPRLLPQPVMHLVLGQREVPRSPGPPLGALPGRTVPPGPARAHRKAGVSVWELLCAQRDTGWPQGQLRAAVFLPCPGVSLGDPIAISPSQVSLRIQALRSSPSPSFTPTPTLIIKSPGDFAENSVLNRRGLTVLSSKHKSIAKQLGPSPSCGLWWAFLLYDPLNGTSNDQSLEESEHVEIAYAIY